jgi:hypothetical protein
MNEQKKTEYTDAEKKQIEIFGHVLPTTGGSHTFSLGEGLKKQADPSLELDKQPGMIRVPTAITQNDLAADAQAVKTGTIVQPAPAVGAAK